MSVYAKSAADLRPAYNTKAGVEQQSSRLFSSLFAKNNPGRRLSVFDAGPANSETVRFFNQIKSRVHICDLYSEELVAAQQDNELTEKELKQEFQSLLGFRVGTLIDICLFWDFLNYLNRPALRAFSAALKPYVHAGTMAHGFSVLNVETPLRNQQYGIAGVDTLSVSKSNRPQLDYYPHTHDELNESLSCFDISRGWLLPDGRLEILMKSVI